MLLPSLKHPKLSGKASLITSSPHVLAHLLLSESAVPGNTVACCRTAANRDGWKISEYAAGCTFVCGQELR